MYNPQSMYFQGPLNHTTFRLILSGEAVPLRRVYQDTQILCWSQIRCKSFQNVYMKFLTKHFYEKSQNEKLKISFTFFILLVKAFLWVFCNFFNGFYKSVRGVLGNKCTGQHNLKTVHFSETLASGNFLACSSAICVFFCSPLSSLGRRRQAFL